MMLYSQRYVALIMVHGFMLLQAASAEIVINRFTNEQKGVAFKIYTRLIEIPDQQKAMLATKDEAAQSAEYLMRWLQLVWNPKWIPNQLKEELIAIKRHPQQADLFIAKYKIQDYEFTIKDGPVSLVLMVKSRRFQVPVSDWSEFFLHAMGTFLRGEEKVKQFKRAAVFHDESFARLDLIEYGMPIEQDPDKTRYWYSGNPVIWKNGDQVVFLFSKLRDGEHPIDDEYGLNQRFPSPADEMQRATLPELVALITGKRGAIDINTEMMANQAERALLKRSREYGNAIDLFIAKFDRIPSSAVKCKVIDLLKVISNHVDQEKRTKIKTFMREKSIEMKDGPVKRQLNETIRLIEFGEQKGLVGPK